MSPALKIGVVACSKTKRDFACRADELYTGRIFRAAVTYLRSLGCERIVILSALHHAIADDRIVAPYEQCLATMDAASRRHWTIVARASLSNTLCAVADVRDLAGVEVHAILPAVYAGALDGLPHVTRHFMGLTPGRLYSALSRALPVPATEVRS